MSNGDPKKIGGGATPSTTAFEWQDAAEEFLKQTSGLGTSDPLNPEPPQVCYSGDVFSYEDGKLTYKLDKTVVTTKLWGKPDPQLTPEIEQQLTLVQVLLDDARTSLDIKAYQNPSPDDDQIREKIDTLLTLTYRALHGEPVDVDKLLQDAAKLQGKIATLDQFNSLYFADPSVNHPGTLDAASLNSPLVAQAREEMTEGILFDSEEQYEQGLKHLQVLKQYSEHIQVKVALANKLRKILPLPVKTGEIPFLFNFADCQVGGDADPIYNMSETPCELIEKHPFYQALTQIQQGDPEWYAKIQKGYSTLFARDTDWQLSNGAGAADPFAHLTEVMASEKSVLEATKFVDLQKRIAEIQFAESGASDMAANRERIFAYAAAIDTYDNTLDMLDWSISSGLSEPVQSAAVVFGLTESFKQEIDGLAKDAADLEFDPLLQTENAKEAYQRLNGGEVDSQAGTIASQKENSIERYNADDFVGSYEDEDAPESSSNFMIDGEAAALKGRISDLKYRFEQLAASDLSPEEKLSQMRELVSDLKSEKMKLLKMFLAKEMAGFKSETAQSANVNTEIEFFGGHDGTSREGNLKQHAAALVTGLENKAFSDVLDRSIAEFKDIKKDIKSGLYGVIKDGMSTAGFDDVIGQLTTAKGLFAQGKIDEARAIYLKIYGSAKYQALMARYGLHQQGEGMVKDFAIQVAIVVASSGIASLATAPFKALATTRGWGAVRTFLACTPVEGGAFYISEQTFQSALTEGGGWGSKTIGEHLYDLTMTTLMFAFLRGPMGAYRNLIKGRVVANIETSLGRKLTTIESEAAFSGWLKTASVLKLTPYHLGAFTVENASFIIWEGIKETISEGGFNKGILDKITNWDAIKDQVFFLCLIKLGNFAAAPFMKPAIAGSEKLFLGEKAAQYQQLQTEAADLMKRMEKVYSEGLVDPAKVDRGQSDRLLAEYLAYSQKRAAFIKGIPAELLDPAALKAADAEVAAAQALNDASKEVDDIGLRPVSEKIFAADAKTIESMKRSGVELTEVAKGVYSVETAKGKVFIVHEYVRPEPVKPSLLEVGVKAVVEKAKGLIVEYRLDELATTLAANAFELSTILAILISPESTASSGGALPIKGSMAGMMDIFGWFKKGQAAGEPVVNVDGAQGKRVGLDLAKIYAGSEYAIDGNLPKDPWEHLQGLFMFKNSERDEPGVGEILYQNAPVYQVNAKALVTHIRFLQTIGKSPVSNGELTSLLLENGFHPNGDKITTSSTQPAYLFATDGSGCAYAHLDTAMGQAGNVYLGQSAGIKIPFGNVAPLHARLRVSPDGTYTLTALDMKSGVSVDGQKLGDKQGITKPLIPGMHEVKLGDVDVKIWIPYPAAEPAPSEDMDVTARLSPAELTKPKQPIQMFTPQGARRESIPLDWMGGVIEVGRLEPETTAAGDFFGIKDTHISANHAKLSKESNGVYVTDNGSTNGTYVNGERIPKGQKIRLYEGDTVTFWEVSYTFHDPEGKKAPALDLKADGGKLAIKGGGALLGSGSDLFNVADMQEGQSIDVGREDFSGHVAWISGKHLKFMKQNGQIFLMDIRLRDRIERHPTILNGKAMAGNKWYVLNEGDIVNLEAMEGLFQKIVFQGNSSIVEKMSAAPTWQVRQVAGVVEAAPHLAALRTSLVELNTEFATSVNDSIGAVLTGKANLTTELSGKVLDIVSGMMAAKVVEIEKSIPWKLHVVYGTYDDVSPEQLKYLEAIQCYAFFNKVQNAKTLDDLILELEATPLSLSYLGTGKKAMIEELSGLVEGGGNGLQQFPLEFGIRQKVRDLLEEYYHGQESENPQYGFVPPPPKNPDLKPHYETLDNMLLDIFEGVRDFTKVRGRNKTYQPSEVEELLYQVLERMSKPLYFITTAKGLRDKALAYMQSTIDTARRLYPDEMQTVDYSKRNPFTGESIDATEHIESLYRFAKMLMNTHAGRPIFGYPTAVEQGEAVAMVNRYLLPSTGKATTYPEAQAKLREHIESASKQFLLFMRLATPTEKQMVIDTYFGNYHHRQFQNVGDALRVAKMLGDMGIYREVGVTISVNKGVVTANLALGDMNSVRSEDHGQLYLMHTHPETYLADNGDWMGEDRGRSEKAIQTVCLSAQRISNSSLNVLFSNTDLHVITRNGKQYMRSGEATGNTAWFNAKSRTYTSWVINPFGMSRMDVKLSPEGRILGVTVKYGVKTTAEAGMEVNSDYKLTVAHLKAEAAQMGLPIIFEQVPFETVSKEYPY